jgi:hypothetical protein
MIIDDLLLLAAEIKDETGAKQNTATRVGTLLEEIINALPKSLQYKGLISQNAPVATTQTPNIIKGQIWEDTVGTIDIADLTVLGAYELISGVLGDVNATYRSAANHNPNFNTSSLAYDGSPYIVSTDANGDFNPSVNTIGDVSYVYRGVGVYWLVLTHAFPSADKVFHQIGNNNFGMIGKGFEVIKWLDADTLEIETSGTTFVNGDNNLSYSPISIEIYP